MNAATRSGPAWRSLRAPALVGLLVVAAVLATVLASAAPTGRLDPTAAGPDGSRAVARIIEDLGADVVRVRSSGAALATLEQAGGSGAPSVLVVVAPELLTPAALDALATRPEPVGVVLVEPTDAALDALVPGVRSAASVSVQTLEPACDLELARRAGAASAGGGRFRVDDQAARGTDICYARGGLGSVVRLHPDGGAPVTVLGSGEALTNQDLDAAGDAALALGLVEGAGTVVWLLPDPLQELPPEDGGASVSDLLPPAVGLVVLQMAVAVALLALARARRLGAPVVEPLPVVVRAAEVVEGRGRLYRAARSRDVAAAALREGARARALPRVGLASGSPRDEVVDAVAARTGDAQRRVASLLYGAPPSDDTGLSALADALDDLDHRLRPGAPAEPAPTRPTEGPRR